YRGRIHAPLEPAPGPQARLRLGAGAERDAANNFLDGDIALPFIAPYLLEEAAIRRLVTDRGHNGLAGIDSGDMLAYWPLDEERGTHAEDRSGCGRHGYIVNHATWRIGGPGHDASLGRPDYLPEADPRRGHALRLSSDDLVDCGWIVTDEFSAPEDAASGLYAARVCLIGQDPATALTLPFAVVRPTPRRPGAIALLLATNTWHAYGRIPRNEIRIPGLASSFYTRHVNGRPFFHLGLRAPIPHANPYGFESERAAYTRHSHLVRPERFAQAWLEAEGYPFECLTDQELHADPTILRNFQVLLICGHNEYWSDAMRAGVLAYLSQGGHVLCMSGNTLYWRVSFDDDMSVMESRKTCGTPDGEWLPPSEWGERWHSTDGLPGGTWQLVGQPTHEVIGLTMQGMIDDGTPTAFAAFQVEEPSHFLFHEPEHVPVTTRGTIGETCLNGPKASGYEMDATPRVVGISSEPIPGMVTLASALGQYSIECAGVDPFHGADLIYWERPGGGQVVNAGSIGFSGALAVDPGVRALMRNVLAHFGVPRGLSRQPDTGGEPGNLRREEN
ncbi:MAG: N,N-dimethylformamidase beta subunit family domain-containing protein, partial [Chloroflexota bacterium]